MGLVVTLTLPSSDIFLSKTLRCDIYSTHLLDVVLSCGLMASPHIIQKSTFTFLCREQRSSQSLLHCLWMSFVVWPYINNVKVMISRLKALSCLVSPSRTPFATSLFPPSVCGPAKGKSRGLSRKEDACWPKRVSQRNRGIPGHAVETTYAPFCFIDYLRKRGRKQRIILRKHLFSAFPLALKFGPTA